MGRYQKCRWPDDTADRIKAMRDADEPWRKIAESFGADIATVRAKAKRLGVFQPSNRYFTAEEDEVIRQDYAGHVPVIDIATKLGRSRADINQRILRKHPDLMNGDRTARGSKAFRRYGSALLQHGATPDEAAQALKAKLIEAKAAARSAAIAAKEKFFDQSIATMHREIEAGKARNMAIFEARALGISLERIAGEFGLTRERVRQICDAEAIRIIAEKDLSPQRDILRVATVGGRNV